VSSSSGERLTHLRGARRLSPSTALDRLCRRPTAQSPRPNTGLGADARALREALDRYGIANTFEVYPGTHTSRIAVRFQQHVLPFLHRTLCADDACR